MTVIAAEWGRSKAWASRGVVVYERIKDPHSFEETSLVISDLSWITELAARSPDVVLPLYNRRTIAFAFLALITCSVC